MTTIKKFSLDEKEIDKVGDFHYGKDWPVVYLLMNKRELYVGETIGAKKRFKEHLKKDDRRRLTDAYIVTDEEYNKSAALDIESWLIQYFTADGQYILQNKNKGLGNHSYYDREKYESKFEFIWKDMIKLGFARKTLFDLRNSDLFKYSPYKALSRSQFEVAEDLTEDIKKAGNQNIIVSGGPGTGKTILATYMVKSLVDENPKLKVALVVPMTSLRKTLKAVFKRISGLKPAMVIGPSTAVKEKYDVLIIDEAHRLRRRKNITNYKTHDDTNRALGLTENGTELDWVTKSAKKTILFYDKNQSVRPSDIQGENFLSLKNIKKYELEGQMRVKGGDEYIQAVNGLIYKEKPIDMDFKNYDFRVFSDPEKMYSEIKKRDKESGLSRIVAGYAWPWVSKKDGKSYDIKIGNFKIKWNTTNENWVNSPNALNEAGCIHTIQGYDLNYVGVIIGKELCYSKEKGFYIDSDNYYDRNGKNGVGDIELKGYILNIYKTLLTRGIKGTYIYAEDEGVRGLFTSRINS